MSAVEQHLFSRILLAVTRLWVLPGPLCPIFLSRIIPNMDQTILLQRWDKGDCPQHQGSSWLSLTSRRPTRPVVNGHLSKNMKGFQIYFAQRKILQCVTRLSSWHAKGYDFQRSANPPLALQEFLRAGGGGQIFSYCLNHLPFVTSSEVGCSVLIASFSIPFTAP